VYTLCWSAKGGSGTSLVAATLAILSARQRPTLLVDLGGDQPGLLGVATPAGPGVGEWLGSPRATAESLLRLAIEIGPGLSLLAAGSLGDGRHVDEVHAERIAHAFAHVDREVVVDAGPHGRHTVLHSSASRSLLVLRPSYLSLQRALQRPGLAGEVIVLRDTRGGYSGVDVANAIAAPVLIDALCDPAVARAADAGLLTSRLPIAWARTFERALRSPVRA
jgi:MinD-like ATPase involved in chromosome partitioning or flagellar assembly